MNPPPSDLRPPTSALRPPTSSLGAAATSGLIQSGDILHVRTANFIGRAIRRAIGSWGNHDAILVRPEGLLTIGESTWPRSQCTDLAGYDRRIASGSTQAIVLRPAGSTPIQGSLAAAWWLRNAQGRPYDLGAYPRLLLKSILGDLCQRAAGWEWAWYCTESCRDAWRNGPSLDPWQKNNPTPRTTEKRLASGAFTLIWSSDPRYSAGSRAVAVFREGGPIRPPTSDLRSPISAFPLTTATLTTPHQAPSTKHQALITNL